MPKSQSVQTTQILRLASLCNNSNCPPCFLPDALGELDPGEEVVAAVQLRVELLLVRGHLGEAGLVTT